MNHNQKLLIELINSVIQEKTPNMVINNKIDWTELHKEARVHQIHPLLYPAVKNISRQGAAGDVIMAWKKETILNGLVQTRHIHQMKNVFHTFHKADIPVIALKGLVIRFLYPQPDLRTMSDADILVKKQDIERAAKALTILGYVREASTPAHISFTHKSHLPIELHWTLTDERYLGDKACFEEGIWHRAVPSQFYDNNCMVLSPEDQAVHLCLHMATHIVSSGFGLRQLCDLAIFINAGRTEFDWDSFYKNIKTCGIERFVPAIFKVCRQLFGVGIPDIDRTEFIEDPHHINLLISDIFSSGVFGKRNLTYMYGNEIGQHLANKELKKPQSVGRVFLAILFPSPGKLSDKYLYAKKTPLLIPVAWIQHFISGIFNREYSFFDKFQFFFATMVVSRRRAKLLQWLNL